MATILHAGIEVSWWLKAIGGYSGCVRGRPSRDHRSLHASGSDRTTIHIDEAHPASISIHLHGGPDYGPVLGSAVELLEGPPSSGGLRHSNLNQHLVGGKVCL
tara:strand:+ start:88 stop:396 length:309 start_codon:yes stop_codon:yes gene_type:complete